ncbi:SRPBCC family protein [Nocardiopsis oceani]
MVERDENGRRHIGTEIEVQGTPEEVWRAIATSDGISSWFYRSRVDGQVGGAAECDFGPGMEARERITEWNPPRRYTSEPEAEASADEEAVAGASGSTAPPRDMATEWIVESRGGGACVVRVVHSWFADSDDWDGQFEGHVYGWAASFFPMLRLYLNSFNGQPCAPFQFTLISPHSGPRSMGTIKDALGIDTTSGRFASRGSAPTLSGQVENLEVTDPEVLAQRERSPHVAAALEAMGAEDADLLLRVEHPAPGLAYISSTPMGEQAMVSIRIHLFGDGNTRIAARAEREWDDWLTEQFPSPASSSEPSAVGS